MYLRGLRGGGRAEPLRPGALPTELSVLTIEWTAAGPVDLSLGGAAAASPFGADSAYLHEPRPDLYAALPLATFDTEAQRFWRRVFAIARFPGGGLLLGLLTRGSRRRR